MLSKQVDKDKRQTLAMGRGGPLGALWPAGAPAGGGAPLWGRWVNTLVEGGSDKGCENICYANRWDWARCEFGIEGFRQTRPEEKNISWSCM